MARMIPGLIGRKIGMTTIVADRGRVEPVTVVRAGPCVVLQVRCEAKDGYDAVQLGFADVKPHRSTKPMIGHAAAAGTGPKAWLNDEALNRIQVPAGVFVKIKT